MDIFVGSLSFKLKESELREAFEKFGKVSSAKIIIDKITRQSKGFGFVEMPDEGEARLAISELNGAEMYGRPLVVNESQKKEARSDAGAPRGEFRREGFNRPRPAGGESSSTGSDRSSNAGAERSSSSAGTDRSSSNTSQESSSGSGFGGGGFGGNEKSSNTGSSDRYRGSNDRGYSSGDKGGHGGDRGGFGGKPRSDDRFGKGETKKGGGGSKNYIKSRNDDDDDDWY
jgi:RNA recognition motif-containing protein